MLNVFSSAELILALSTHLNAHFYRPFEAMPLFCLPSMQQTPNAKIHVRQNAPNQAKPIPGLSLPSHIPMPFDHPA
jgi:hypothetical protein